MDKKFDYFLEGKTGKWEVVIGLEVHAQITSNAKLFSSSSTKFGSNPNSQVSFVDAAMPGMLPVINKYCVEQAVKTGLGLKATINNFSKFDRKNYFYADLPQGYQISQFKFPIVGEGEIVLDMPYGTKIAGIERLHLEQDAGKSLHDQDPSSSFVDLNRSGIALMEIVGKPDLRSPDEVAQYVKKLRSIMRYLNTCDGNMDEGSLRADVNVSVRKVGSSDLGTRCEIKNVNSIKFMQQAIEYEAKRQIEIIEEGGIINQQTRLFDTKKIETRSMRSKEDAHDYRYFPDPDLLPLVLEQSFVDKIKNSLPELPDEKKIRLMNDFDLSSYDASIVVSDQDISQYYEEVAKDSDYKLAANWMIVELFGVLNKEGKEIKDSPVSAKNLSKLINLIKDNTISGKIAKTVFEEMVKNNEDPEKIVNEKGMKQQSDPEELKKIIDTILKNNQDKIEQYKAGKVKLFGFFVGEAMKNTQGKGNPKLINDILKEQLK